MSYGVFAWNANGIETTAIDGRCFFLDVITVDNNNRNGRRSYHYEPGFEITAIVNGYGDFLGGRIRVTINGNTVSWNSNAEEIAVAGFIFVCLREN